MDLKQLEYFVRVAEFGSFSRAAVFLNIAQPALSRHVRVLEVELRQTLFIRNGRGVGLTDAGRRLLAHGIGILQQVEHAKQVLQEERDATVGNVTIGFPPSLGRILTVSVVKEFGKRFPQATVRIVEGLSNHIQEWISIGRVDIGFLYNPVPAPTIETSFLLKEQLYLMSAPSGKNNPICPRSIRLSDLPNYPLVLPGRPHSIRMLLETEMANAGLKINVASEVDGLPSILELVRQGLGHAVLSMNAIRGTTFENILLTQAIAKPTLTSVLTIAKSQQRPLTPLAHSTIAMLKELIKSNFEAREERSVLKEVA